MVLTADQQRVKSLLTETITLLCKNGLHFKSSFCIEGLIGITLDQDDVFLVNINETVCAHFDNIQKADWQPACPVLEESVGVGIINRRRFESSGKPDPLKTITSESSDISDPLCKDASKRQNVLSQATVSHVESSSSVKWETSSVPIQFSSNVHDLQKESNGDEFQETLISDSLRTCVIEGSDKSRSLKWTASDSRSCSDENHVQKAQGIHEPAKKRPLADIESGDHEFTYKNARNENVCIDFDSERYSGSNGEVTHIKEETASDEDLAYSDNSFHEHHNLSKFDSSLDCVTQVAVANPHAAKTGRSAPGCSAWNRQYSTEQLVNPNLQMNVADSMLLQDSLGWTKVESSIEAEDSLINLKAAISCNYSGRAANAVIPQVKLAKRYECSFCGKRFSATNNLRGHLVHHTGIKEFVCSICKKEFRYKQDLKRHVVKCLGDGFG